MVAVAQLVRVSDCGPEGRGFDPHQPPGKEEVQKTSLLFFITKIVVNERNIKTISRFFKIRKITF